MNDNDKGEFKTTMHLMCDAFKAPRMSNDDLRTWFNALIDLSAVEVLEKVDEWMSKNSAMPTIDDFLPKTDITIRPRVVTPLTLENNKAHMVEVQQDIQIMKKKAKDDRAWAKRIISGEFKSNWGGAIDYAKSALNMPIVKS